MAVEAGGLQEVVALHLMNSLPPELARRGTGARPWQILALGLVVVGLVVLTMVVLGWNDSSRAARNGVVLGPLLVLTGLAALIGATVSAGKGGVLPRFANPVSGWQGMGVEYLGGGGILCIGATPLARLAILGDGLSAFQWFWVAAFASVTLVGAIKLYLFTMACLGQPSVVPERAGLMVRASGALIPWSEVITVGVDSVWLWRLRIQPALVLDVHEQVVPLLEGTGWTIPGARPGVARVTIPDFKAAGLVMDAAALTGGSWRGEGRTDLAHRSAAARARHSHLPR